MKPFYQSADGRITVYHSRWEDVLAAGLVPVRDVKLVHADPPYGMRLNTKARATGRVVVDKKRGYNGGTPRGRSWDPIIGDDRPFDPASLLALDRPLVTWGANHYSSRLPDSPSWIFWDKRADGPEIDNGCGELAWSNLGGPTRRFKYLWRGVLRGSHRGGKQPGGRPVFEQHLGPTEKPVALSVYVGERAKMRAGDLLFVPCLGTGPDLAAAHKLGWRVIACDVDRHWCHVACSARLGVVSPERAAEPCGPLFGGGT